MLPSGRNRGGFGPGHGASGGDHGHHRRRNVSVFRNGTLVYKTAWDLGMVVLDGKPRTTPLVQLQFNERNAEISPDGRSLAHGSISTDGGRTPAWVRSGRELFFVNGDSIVAVDVRPTTTFGHGNPTRLFDARSIVLDARISGGAPTAWTTWRRTASGS